MIKKKLVLKKQVIATLSDLEKKNVLGGFAKGTGGSLPVFCETEQLCPTVFDTVCDCDISKDHPCPSGVLC